MALNKQSIAINFAGGLDLKTDDKQVPAGKFLALSNSIFNKGGLLQKRNGYQALTSLPDATSTLATTFNGNLTAIGANLRAYNSGNRAWYNKGTIQPLQMEVLPLIRSSTNQIQSDSVVADNGLICTVYTDNVPSGGVISPVYKVVIADASTGQNILAPTALTSSSGTVAGSPRVFLLNNKFIIVVTTSTNRLEYIAINTSTPTTIPAGVTVTTAYVPASGVAFDGVVYNGYLYLAWAGTGTTIKMTSISSTLVIATAVSFATQTCTIMSVCADTTNAVIYASYYDSAGSTGYTLAVDGNLNTVHAPTQIITTGTVSNITTTASAGVCYILYQLQATYSYGSSARTDIVKQASITQGGSFTAATDCIRGAGLASKAFMYNSVQYFLASYSSTNQPSYFLMNRSGQVVGKLAYSNGYGYYTLGLPSVSMSDNIVRIPYLLKDSIQSVNKTQGVANSAGIYAQTGINLATFTFGTDKLSTAEIGNNLHISGGLLFGYDGYAPTEQGFNVWPDNVLATSTADPVTTGDRSNGTNTLLNVASTTNVVVGMNVTGTGIPASTTVTAISGTTVTMSANATSTAAGMTITFTGNVSAQQYYYQVTYEWADNQGNIFRSAPSIPVTATATAGHTITKLDIPTLRLTYKTANPVKIVIYRWSTAQQSYYQVTTIANPLLNVTTSDSASFIDYYSDAAILGNNLIYTTGGVLENIGPPAASAITLFNNRLFAIDAEDPNLLWYSKQVIESTPVEMSDLLTLYVAPTTSAQGSTGPTRCAAPMDDKLILFKDNAIFYISGQGPDNTGTNNQYSDGTYITSTVGCNNQKSIVLTPNGLMFQSSKGIWLLGRDLSTRYIGASVEDLEQGSIVQSAVNIPNTNQIRFTLDTGVTLMYDYYYDQWGTFTNVPAISSTLYQDLHTYINDSGQVFQENPGSYLDGGNPVLMSFTTSWFNLTGLQGFQRAYFFYLLGTYKSPHKIALNIAYNYDSAATQTTIITPDNYTPPWGDDNNWGGGDTWGGVSQIEQWRVFLQRQKCQSFQITLNELYDPSIGVAPGAGLTLSGLNLVIGGKAGYPKLRAARSVG